MQLDIAESNHWRRFGSRTSCKQRIPKSTPSRCRPVSNAKCQRDHHFRPSGEGGRARCDESPLLSAAKQNHVRSALPSRSRPSLVLVFAVILGRRVDHICTVQQQETRCGECSCSEAWSSSRSTCFHRTLDCASTNQKVTSTLKESRRMCFQPMQTRQVRGSLFSSQVTRQSFFQSDRSTPSCLQSILGAQSTLRARWSGYLQDIDAVVW